MVTENNMPVQQEDSSTKLPSRFQIDDIVKVNTDQFKGKAKVQRICFTKSRVYYEVAPLSPMTIYLESYEVDPYDE